MKFGQVAKKEMLFKDTSIFGYGSDFIRPIINICAVMVKGITNNISVKYFCISSSCLGEDVFIDLALAAILLHKAVPFVQFW